MIICSFLPRDAMQARPMSSCSVCVSVTFVNSVKTNKRSIRIFFTVGQPHHSSFSVPNGIAVFRREPRNGGVKCKQGRQKSRFEPAVNAATGQVLSVRSPVGGPRLPLASSDTSVVVSGPSGGVDCGRRRRNVYDKKPQRQAKDNKTAHLTARSDKSVAYVTNNKRLYSTFGTVEANY